MVWTCALCLQEMEKCQVPGLFWQSGEMLRYPEIKKNTTIPAALILKLRLAENIVWSNKAVHWRVCPLSAVDGLLVENWPSSSHQRGPTTPHIIQSWSSSNFPSPSNQLVFWCSPMFALSEQINVDPIINYIVRRANQIIFCLTSTPADRRPLE